MQIAIDGPAGSGKSTVAKLVADRLKCTYIDTGAMYRALTLRALQKNITVTDSEALSQLAQMVNIHFQTISNRQHVFCDGEDVTQAIRSPEVTAAVSSLAQCVPVRKIMVAKQQEMAQTNSVVMDGRDIGEVVLPQADFKIFLTASLNERARRRMLEWEDEGFKPLLTDVKKVLLKRDNDDAEREIGALKILPDSIVVDTTHIDVNTVVDTIMNIIGAKEAL